jgi:nicotinate-nucleotide adenylyltransferase
MEQRRERIGVFGGTFDPVHDGHVAAARAARSQLGLDVVLMVVAPRPWQKVASRSITDAETRFAALERRIAGIAGLQASRLEIDGPEGPTYTVDTLRRLQAQRPDAQLFLIAGTDVRLDTWKDPVEIARLADLVIVNRAGYDRLPIGEPWRVHHVQMDPVALSSTDLRARGGDAPYPD